MIFYAGAWLCGVVLAILPSSAAESESIILDDKENQGGASFFWPSTGEHSSEWVDRCFSDAHGDGFHYDSGQNQQQSSFTFEFVPPETGCYRLEEHSLKAAEDSCIKRLAESVQLTVNPLCTDCGLKKYTINSDQRGKLEAQWNALGQLTFYAGHTYSLSLRNANSFGCAPKELLNTSAEAASGACSWATTTALDNQLECKDGTLCTGWTCCSDRGGRGGRAKCPPNNPIMCNARICGQFDFCCERSCEGLGGARQCPQALCAILKNNVGKCYNPANLPSPASLSYYKYSSSTSAFDFWDGTWAYVVADHRNGGTASCGQAKGGSSGGFYASTSKPTIMVIGCSSLHADNTPTSAEGYGSLRWTDIGPSTYSHDGINHFKAFLPVGTHIICCKHSWALGAWIKEHEELETDQCLVLADALRLTRISSDCPSQEYDRAERHDINLVRARKDALANIAWTNGRIRLTTETLGSGGYSSSLDSLEGMQATLWQYRAVVETALKDILRAEQVKVAEIKVGRATLEVSFVVTGHHTTDMNKNDFARKLSNALQNAGADLKVVAIEIAWHDEELPPEQVGPNAGFIIAMICGGILVCACAVYFMWKFECRKESNGSHQDAYSPDAHAPNTGVVPPSRHIDLESAGDDPRIEPSEEPRAQSSVAQHLPEPRPSAEAPTRSSAEQWARERGDKLMTELRVLEQLPEEQRRAGLRALQRELHPDKIDPHLRGPQAQSLFEIVQAKWERLDNERRSRVESSTAANTTASQYGKPETQPDQSNLRPSTND